MRHDGVSLKKMPDGRVLDLPNLGGNEVSELEASGVDISLQNLSFYVSYAGQGPVDVLKLSSSRSTPRLTPSGQILKLKV